MPTELDALIDESLLLRRQTQQLQEQYDAKRKRILAIMTDANQRVYYHGACRAVCTEPISIESVSKELLIKALKEVDIPRDKKVFIWNTAIKEVRRPGTVMLQMVPTTVGKADGDAPTGDSH
jgi:hypothetical protein